MRWRCGVLVAVVGLFAGVGDAAAWSERRSPPDGWRPHHPPPVRHFDRGAPRGEILYDRFGRPRAYVVPRGGTTVWTDPRPRYDTPRYPFGYADRPMRTNPGLDWR